MSYGEQLLDYLPINIAVKKIYNILKYKNGIFNISSGSPISLRRLLENIMIKKKKKIKLNLGYYNYRKKDSLAIWGD
jgi:dTDP-6-deoxy-L-talose 4-dehydrogenase (NAD+)